MLHAALTTHRFVVDREVTTVRTGAGVVRYHPDFIERLDDDTLAELMRFEGTRILLGHPYERRLPDAERTYDASNLCVQEYARTSLPVPSAREVFGEDVGPTHLEDLYRRLGRQRSGEEGGETSADRVPRTTDDDAGDDDAGDDDAGDGHDASTKPPSGADAADPAGTGADGSPEASAGGTPTLDDHFRQTDAADEWGPTPDIEDALRIAIERFGEETDWGTLPPTLRRHLRPSPGVAWNPAAFLNRLRADSARGRRVPTRMRPHRRYGFDALGSRHETALSLLVAVDVSGSMNPSAIERCLAAVQRLVRRDVDRVRLITFDDRIHRDEPLRRRHDRFETGGGGGTSYRPIVREAARARYDGVIVMTDGRAEPPTRDDLRRTRPAKWLWLFPDADAYGQSADALRDCGTVQSLG